VIELDETRADLATSRLQSGLRDTRRAMRPRAVTLAEQLHETESEFNKVTQIEASKEFSAPSLDATFDDVRRLRKLTEIIEDDMGVSIGSSKFGRVATGISTLSSVGSILVSGQNVLETASVLVRRSEQSDSLSVVSRKHFEAFYGAIGIFTINCMLYTTPLKFKTAWRGTRYINNRFLYRLRGVSGNLHRFILSELHYLIREILPRALKQPVEFTKYLKTMSVTTLIQIKDFGSLPKADAFSKAKSIIQEFIEFADSTVPYDLPSVNLQSLASEVLTEVINIFSGPLFSTQFVSRNQYNSE